MLSVEQTTDWSWRVTSNTQGKESQLFRVSTGFKKACFQYFIKHNGLSNTRRCKHFRETFRDKTDRMLLHYFCQADQINSQVRKSIEWYRKLITSWQGINFLERNWENGKKEKAMKSETCRRQKSNEAMHYKNDHTGYSLYSGKEFDQNMPHFVVHT